LREIRKGVNAKKPEVIKSWSAKKYNKSPE
jgi:hypothetical protein